MASRPEACQVRDMTVLCGGDADTLNRPCVDCGLYTGRYCDYCLAASRIPTETWIDNQHTPLCSKCDNRFGKCHFCRGQSWATRPPWRPEPETEPPKSQADAPKPDPRFRLDVEQLQQLIAGGVEALSPLDDGDIEAFMQGLASVGEETSNNPLDDGCTEGDVEAFLRAHSSVDVSGSASTE